MDRMLSLLGLCARAGKLITGEKACVQAIRGEGVFAALLDGAGRLLRANVPDALGALKEMGVARWAVVHCPEGGFGLDENGAYVEVPGLILPPGYIKGSVGAGDAFCSGVLYAAWRGQDLREAIELGTAAAACSLSQPDATSGMRDHAGAMALYRELR